MNDYSYLWTVVLAFSQFKSPMLEEQKCFYSRWNRTRNVISDPSIGASFPCDVPISNKYIFDFSSIICEQHMFQKLKGTCGNCVKFRFRRCHWKAEVLRKFWTWENHLCLVTEPLTESLCQTMGDKAMTSYCEGILCYCK